MWYHVYTPVLHDLPGTLRLNAAAAEFLDAVAAGC